MHHTTRKKISKALGAFLLRYNVTFSDSPVCGMPYQDSPRKHCTVTDLVRIGCLQRQTSRLCFQASGSAHGPTLLSAGPHRLVQPCSAKMHIVNVMSVLNHACKFSETCHCIHTFSGRRTICRPQNSAARRVPRPTVDRSSPSARPFRYTNSGYPGKHACITPR